MDDPTRALAASRFHHGRGAPVDSVGEAISTTAPDPYLPARAVIVVRHFTARCWTPPAAWWNRRPGGRTWRAALSPRQDADTENQARWRRPALAASAAKRSC